MMHIITSEIDVNQILNSMTDKSGQSGATVVFTGSVRNSGKRGPVTEMYYEAYTEMAEKTLKKNRGHGDERMGYKPYPNSTPDWSSATWRH